MLAELFKTFLNDEYATIPTEPMYTVAGLLKNKKHQGNNNSSEAPVAKLAFLGNKTNPYILNIN